jgi:demethylmenaquinone methyltransferase/2-methoxy-6-polyprenyl-1,4-benzoquinol methylase
MAKPQEVDSLLSEQIAYYRAIAREYEDHAISGDGRPLLAAVEAFRPTGHVLEFACGFGAWTKILLRSALTVTAVDAAPEMLARAKAALKDDRVRFIHSDIFQWKPDRLYNEIFFGFWLSHVPMDLFETFWALVAKSLEPNGRVLFVDDNYRAQEELFEGETSATVLRRLNDGSAYRAVKVPHHAEDLEKRLKDLGWNFKVTESGPFYWGWGTLI